MHCVVVRLFTQARFSHVDDNCGRTSTTTVITRGGRSITRTADDNLRGPRFSPPEDRGGRGPREEKSIETGPTE